jgi:hypothetical protein
MEPSAKLKFIRKFEELLQKKLVSLVDHPDRRYPHEIFTNEVEKTYDWCRIHGIFHSWHFHEHIQLYEPGKNVIARVDVSKAMGKIDAFFLVPLELAEKALLLGELPE